MVVADICGFVRYFCDLVGDGGGDGGIFVDRIGLVVRGGVKFWWISGVYMSGCGGWWKETSIKCLFCAFCTGIFGFDPMTMNEGLIFLHKTWLKWITNREGLDLSKSTKILSSWDSKM